ncbi:threonine synthase [Halostagnicola kamekurae]|uniref:L-threonine synthase n=1 Tax=Halostagnicola kamekurae TaxID=619731 RepID=A0A1I6PVF8_9EURY|nr:threonine synthase [Halostagnicola kamekurae]SFS44152.1 L-threonine synthase [Halostagnicola kamekurae]
MVAADLYCPDCGTVYEAGPGEPWRCACGHPLELREDPSRAEAVDFPSTIESPPAMNANDGLWTFADLLPVEKRVTLQEGLTPLVETDRWNASFKLEYVSPTGSFKDRGATTTLSRAVELGVDTVIEDSSGNAGAAIATYAARAGLDAEIYVPADVKPAKRRAIERAGARAVAIEGSREDVTEACLEAVAAGDGWYASHAWNPAFYAGTMTFAFEIAAQRDWAVPDAVVLPVGHGTLFLGAYRGFSRLVEAGLTDELPRLLGVQAVGSAPVVRRLEGETGVDETSGDGTGDAPEAGDPTETTATLADGIRIATPAREDEILDAIDATDGDAIAVGDETLETTLESLHTSGFNVEPTSAVAPAGLERYREQGMVEPDDEVVVPLTGSGLKYS